MMNLSAMKATKSTNNQDYFFSGTIDIHPMATAYHFQPSIAAWAGNLFLAPNKKHFYQCCVLVHILLQ